MRVMVIVKANEESESEGLPSEWSDEQLAMLEEMGKFNDELIKAGLLITGDGLKPSRFGKRVHFDGKQRIVTDGPFTEAKELVAGFWVWQVRSMEEAVEWVKRCPNPMSGPSDIEIRPFHEPEEFEAATAKKQQAVRAKLTKAGQ
jgi:hypothetical protein